MSELYDESVTVEWIRISEITLEIPETSRFYSLLSEIGESSRWLAIEDFLGCSARIVETCCHRHFVVASPCVHNYVQWQTSPKTYLPACNKSKWVHFILSKNPSVKTHKHHHGCDCYLFFMKMCSSREWQLLWHHHEWTIQIIINSLQVMFVQNK